MIFDHPLPSRQDQLLSLWKTAFGDHGGFWEMFLKTAFLPDHCRCVMEEDVITAAMCWFDCTCDGQKIAYIYAVVTHPDHRGKGLCRRLLADVHSFLQEHGYAAAMLVPENENLRQMYRKLGYQDSTSVSEFSCRAEETTLPLRTIGPAEYAALRRKFLPRGSVLQEGKNLDFLANQAQFFTGGSVLLAAYQEEDTLHCLELLGDWNAAPAIVYTLGCTTGHFRTPGEDKPFAMLHTLTETALSPSYFGFAFD